MPFLIDGNNLMHALAKAGVEADRAKLAAMLSRLAQRVGQRACVVFDGRSPLAYAGEIDEPLVSVMYSGRRTADDVIAEVIVADTAPRRLVVVSGDHAVLRAAHKRRCRLATSEEFCPTLLAAQRPPKPQPSEPAEKENGLGEEETRKWLREFGLEE